MSQGNNVKARTIEYKLPFETPEEFVKWRNKADMDDDCVDSCDICPIGKLCDLFCDVEAELDIGDRTIGCAKMYKVVLENVKKEGDTKALHTEETIEDVLPAQMLSKMTFSKEKWDEIIARNVWPIDKTPFQMRKDILEPVSIDKDRVLMKNCEEKDGLIELRKGVSDVSIGDALYAHVIIRYDEDHYIKGMAIYSDDIPSGFDMVVNYSHRDPVRVMTNKCAFSVNDHRPIKQQFYDSDAKLSPINIIAMEGEA